MSPDAIHDIESRGDELQNVIIDPVDLAADIGEAFLWGLRLFHDEGLFIRRPASKSKSLGSFTPLAGARCDGEAVKKVQWTFEH
jgi:hypothetical protein